MPHIPSLSGREVVKAFESLGWMLDQQNGSHIVLVKAGERASLCVPDHKEIRKGTLRGLIRTANLTVDEFLAAV